jgi:probable phosphoglycerate mutase
VTTFLLIRHASHGLLGNVLVGRSPGVSLSDQGRAEADRLAQYLTSAQLEAIYTSPQNRARETAAPLERELALTAQVDLALDEIDFGSWTGETFARLDPQPEWQRWNACRSEGCSPGGESMRMAQERIANGMGRLSALHPGATVALVSHCDVIKAAVMDVLHLSLDEFYRFEISPASVSVVTVSEDERKVLLINGTAELLQLPTRR